MPWPSATPTSASTGTVSAASPRPPAATSTIRPSSGAVSRLTAAPATSTTSAVTASPRRGTDELAQHGAHARPVGDREETVGP